jgi:hypothetical protein
MKGLQSSSREYFINLLINDLNNELIEIKKANQAKKNINDIVYYSVSNKRVISARIVEIDYYPDSNGGSTNTFYWVTPKSFLVRQIEHVRYKWSCITKKPYIPGKWFFTHSVQLGTDIFLNEDDAEQANILQNAIFYLYELTT